MSGRGNDVSKEGSGFSGFYGLWAAVYAAFVVYGSLIPFEYQELPLAAARKEFGNVRYLQLAVTSRADWVANILLYVPLAFLLSGATVGRCRAFACRWLASGGVFVLCAALAVAVEFAQLFFPQRTVSLNDIYAEIMGSALGCLLWLRKGGQLDYFRRALAARSAETPRILVLLYCVIYVLLALFPFDFLVSEQELAWKLNGGAWGFWQAGSGCNGAVSCLWQRLAEVLAALPVGVGLVLWLPGRAGSWGKAIRWGFGLGLILEALQFLTASNVSQGVSVLCRGVGVLLGYAACRWFRRDWLARGLGWLAKPPVMLLVCLLYVGWALRWVLAGKGPWLADAVAGHRLATLRFIPFYYHYFTSETRAVESFLLNFWLYAPLGVLAFAGMGRGRAARAGLWAAGILGALASFDLELAKLWLARTHPDPTNVLIGTLGALFGFWATGQLHSTLTVPGELDNYAESSGAAGMGRRHWLLRPWTVLAVMLLFAGTWLFAALPALPAGPSEKFADERFYPKLPEPSQLPAVHLPGFNARHPRLPAPTPAELAKLRADNPDYLKRVATRAQGGAGPFDAAILAAYLQPEAASLDLLFRRLMEPPSAVRRGGDAKWLAWAYDWLYDRWSPAQRASLLDKTLIACLNEITSIRNARLSPYNDSLYNGPLQSLMACAIALFGDGPDAAQPMHFTHDLWKNRVLPAWRQVMGRNGGWHEGGEYVGIGIGKAVYQLPAMWRAATGEDLFSSEPGLRGFLDFLVYRTRPDGTYLRLGDTANFVLDAPDRIPLAIEYGHSAAYSLKGCPRPDEPSAWPWGPLTRQELCSPAAVAQLPLQRLFDGVGLVVARSGWDPGATLLAFKAGDNFWSHSHLDQGAFTIYKGGALAIDSGLYGTGYGSDHHMNYAYQTIAHNAIIVTDPADIAPMPTKRDLRSIANDGGQRRVGSGWGQDPAPLDRAEWERKREIYHTGRLLAFYDRQDLVVAVADLTAAYTNRSSGKGSFFARTRRVEGLIRTFLYDRINDVVVVHDRVRSTDPGFVKRSLVHSLEQPVRTESGFRLSTKPEPVSGKSGSILDVHVLWPEDAFVDFVGGPGAEFWVDGRNYDDNGQVWRIAAQRPQAEPGRWRAEIKPRRPAVQDDFLMVLQPRLADRPEPVLRIRKAKGEPGCEIAGPGRMLAVSFPKNANLPVIRLDGRALEW